MITTPTRPARWVAASFLLLIGSTWGGCGLVEYVRTPKWVSAGGTAAEHVRRGGEIFDSRYGYFDDYPSSEAMRIAALEYEAALLIEPRNADALMGKAEILESLGNDAEGPRRVELYQEALARTQSVPRKSPQFGRAVDRRIAGLYVKLGEPSIALGIYRRLLGTSPNAVDRFDLHHKIAGALERAGKPDEALRLYEKLERWTGGLGSYETAIERLR